MGGRPDSFRWLQESQFPDFNPEIMGKAWATLRRHGAEDVAEALGLVPTVYNRQAGEQQFAFPPPDRDEYAYLMRRRRNGASLAALFREHRGRFSRDQLRAILREIDRTPTHEEIA